MTGDIGHLWVIDTTTHATVAIPVSLDNWLLDVDFAPDGTRAYIACGDTNAIYVLDTATYHIVGQIKSSIRVRWRSLVQHN
jgi:YVTN family beta-propeller protein